MFKPPAEKEVPTPKMEVLTYCLAIFFLELKLELKEIGPREGRASLAPPFTDPPLKLITTLKQRLELSDHLTDGPNQYSEKSTPKLCVLLKYKTKSKLPKFTHITLVTPVLIGSLMNCSAARQVSRCDNSPERLLHRRRSSRANYTPTV